MQYVRRSDLNFKLNNLENKIELLEKEKNDALAQGLVLSYDLSEWKREVVELCEYIGVSMYDCKDESEMLEKAYEELDKRLVPKGIEWSKFEDGFKVRTGKGRVNAQTDDLPF